MSLKSEQNKENMLAVSKSKYHRTEKQLALEEEQILAAKADRRQFRVLYEKYYEQIYRYVYQRLESSDLVADVVSQTFLRAMNKLDSYEYRGLPFSAWLYRIAQNELNQVYRAHKNQRVVCVDSEQLAQIGKDLETEEVEENEEQIRQLKQVLTELSTEEVAIVELRFFEKRPFKEVGEILNITENNAKVRTYRILDKLKKRLTTIKA